MRREYIFISVPVKIRSKSLRSVLLSLMVCLMETNLNIIENWKFGFSSPYDDRKIISSSSFEVGHGVTFTFLPFRVGDNL